MVVLRPWLAAGRPIIRADPLTGGYTRIFADQEGHFLQDLPSRPPLFPFYIPRTPGSELNPFLVALSCLHKLDVNFRRQEQHGLSPNTSPNLTLYKALDELSTEIWAPLSFNPPPSAQTVRSLDAGRRSRRVEPGSGFTSKRGSGGWFESGRGDENQSQEKGTYTFKLSI